MPAGYFSVILKSFSHLLIDAALVHPGHKNLSWLTVAQKTQAHARFKEELYNIAGIGIY